MWIRARRGCEGSGGVDAAHEDGKSIGAEDTSSVLQLLLQRVHSIESKLDSLIGSAVKSIPSERLGKRIEAATDTASEPALFDETVLRKK